MGYTIKEPQVRLRPRLILLLVLLGSVVASNAASVRSARSPLSDGLSVVERQVDANAELGATARCRVIHGAGTVTIHPSEARTGRVTVRVHAAADDSRTAATRAHECVVRLDASGNGLVVSTPRLLPAGVLVDVDLAVPAGVPIDLETTGGRTVATDVGPLVVRSQAGDIELTSPAGRFELETGSGHVLVTLLREQRYDGKARTLSGAVAVRNRLHAAIGKSTATFPVRVEARSQRGQITGVSAGEQGPVLSIDTLDGDIDVQEI